MINNFHFTGLKNQTNIDFKLSRFQGKKQSNFFKKYF